MNTLLSPDETFVLLAHVAGLRKRQGGKHQARFAPIKSESPGQRFAGERARYASTETGFRRDVQNLYASLERGDIGLGTFYRTFSTELYRFHVKMYLLGRRAVGREDSQLGADEMKLLHGKHAQEMKWFNGFIRDYLKQEGRMPYPQRLDLYALAGYGTYMRGALGALPFAHLMRFPWIMNPEAESCDDCLWKEEESNRRGGFTLEELDKEIGYPTEKCKCGRRCRCHLGLPGGHKQLPRTRPTAYKALKRRTKGIAITKKQAKRPTGTAGGGVRRK